MTTSLPSKEAGLRLMSATDVTPMPRWPQPATSVAASARLDRTPSDLPIMAVPSWCAGKSTAESVAEETGDLGRRLGAIEIAERAVLAHLPRRFDEARHRRAPQRSGEAHAANARALELRERERLAANAHHEIHRLRDRLADSPYGSEIGKPGSEEHVG